MSIKTTLAALAVMALLAAGIPAHADGPSLPRVEILGKEYYLHEVQKGESVYGVAHKYGWDLNELVRLNPHTSSEMKRGARLYYPTGRVTVLTQGNPQHDEDTQYEPIRHTVQRGETVYSISKLYNIPLDAIYAAYPNAKYGIRAGDTLVLEQNPVRDNRYLYYVIKPGDTLYSLAKKHNTTVESILDLNPGVSEMNFRIGDTVRIALNTNDKLMHTELVEEERLASIDTYKVRKNDTWNSISSKTGVDVETLREANETVATPEKNEVLNIPVVETVQVEKEVAYTDPREESPEGIQEIYDSIHKVDSDVERLAEVRLAVLLDDPASKKDIDFSRGFLLGIDELKKSPYRINVKFIDGRSSTRAVTEALDDFNPTVLLATADKTFPAFLADYGETNHLEIVNVFDVRNDLYEDNPSMVQLLVPSQIFNEQAASRLASDLDGREWLMVGPDDSNDGIATLLEEKIDDARLKRISHNSLAELPLKEDGRYAVYGFTQKKDELTDLLHTVGALREKYPLADFTVVGRPSWVTMTEAFRDKFDAADVLVPARCWFDPESREGRLFTETYEKSFPGQTPVKSYPNFAATGYDTARYFAEAAARNGGDFNRPTPVGNGIQTVFDLRRVSNWGGFVNPTGFILNFRPSGYADKTPLK